MKLSIAWIFDHINTPWQTVDVPALVNRINQVTAEIEGFSPITFAIQHMSLARVTAITGQEVRVQCPEWNKDITLPVRKDAVVGSWYLIKQHAADYAWAVAADFGSGKEHMLPSMDCSPQERGEWKKSCEAQDYIIELDNKSITHRPDLWCHRGFAREIAALLGFTLKPLQEFIIKKNVIDVDVVMAAPELKLVNQAPDACKRIAGLYIGQLQTKPSLLAMASRLCRVDSRPINLIVDATNYVMFDIGQPMHAFDASALDKKILAPRFARAQEKLTVLDGTTLELSPQDLIITDGTKPLALAGIMGGSSSGVTADTKDIIVEAACFDATTIRKAAARHKLRTEASARFEKSLDPNQIIPAIERFVYLLQQAGMAMKPAADIVVSGKAAREVVLHIAHDLIERRLGTVVEPAFIIATLQNLGFAVEHKGQMYVVTVPSFRSSKDVTLEQDIIEEIGRFVGYTTIPRTLPLKAVNPFDLTALRRLRTIKRVMAYALSMRELYNYAFYDEEFLQQLQWQPPHDTPAVQNPVSEHWRRLVTSLVPHLLKAVASNSAEHDSLRFFEWARTWSKAGGLIVERKSLAALIYEKKKAVDFYQEKAQLQVLFDALSLPVTWHKVSAELDPWYVPHQTAVLMHGNRQIGYAGKVNQLFVSKLFDGDAYCIELDGAFLVEHAQSITQYKPVSKYPDAVRDISMLVPSTITVDTVRSRIQHVDERIVSAVLIDFFEKPEWVDQRSLTVRLTVQDAHKTLTTQEVDTLIAAVTTMLQSLGAQIR